MHKMKTTTFFSLLFVSTFLQNFAFAQLPQISIQGNKFVDDQGQTMVFKGVNASDPAKLQRDGHWEKAYFEEAQNWGSEIIRLPVHPVNWRQLGSDAYLKLLDNGIQWATETGMYVVIDWHSIGNLRTGMFQHPMYDTDLKETFNFWRTIAQRYKGNTTVAFFELFNEPTTIHGQLGTCTWLEWKKINEELIAMIRANGSEAIPLIGGFNWAYDLTEIIENPIDAEGIAYVSHPYPQKRDKPWEEKWTADWGFAAEKYPLMLTEIGYCGPEDKGAHIPVISDDSYAETIVQYCAERGISYIVWVFDPNWAPGMFSDWEYTPTRQGRFFKNLWQGEE